MPFPLAVWIVVASISLLSAGAAVVLNWDDIVSKLKGRRLAVLGARGVGKTQLIKFLTTGTIPTEYKQTVAPQKNAERRFKLKELNLKIQETLDISGDKAAYAEWKELHDKADLVLYLLRADRLIAGDKEVETRVRDDLRHIGGWRESREPNSRLFIVGTHCDRDAEFVKLSADKRGEFTDKFHKLPVVSELLARAGGAHNVKVVLGSMKTIQNTEELVYEIFAQVAS